MAFKVGYFLRESAGNLRRNFLMTIAATLTAAVSLLLLGGVLTLGDFVRGITGQIERQVEVSVFLKDEITEEQQTDIQKTVEDLPVVRSVDYVSKDEAYEEFKQLYRDQPALYENVKPEDLPASFRVAMRDPERVDLIRSKLDGNPAIEEIADQRATVDKLVRFTRLLRTFSGVMVLVLFVAAVLLISNTIQLAIFARRKEIEIMKLVGATNWFVRVPFMFEGVTAGILGAVVALTLLGLGKLFLRGLLPVFVPTGPLHGFDVSQFVTLLAAGAAIGAIGSVVALRRFLEA